MAVACLLFEQKISSVVTEIITNIYILIAAVDSANDAAFLSRTSFRFLRKNSTFFVPF